jgi:hypothetical protein
MLFSEDAIQSLAAVKGSRSAPKAIAEARYANNLKNLNDAQRAYLEFVPNSLKKRWASIIVGENTSPSKCIAMKCMECVGYIKEEVRVCSAVACPLYYLRPYK